jgi:hypothetical protein
VIVWVQHWGDRPYLSLEWHDPATGKRRSKSAETCNPLEAEKKRADLEYELHNGLHRQASGMSWERFRELSQAEHLSHVREGTRKLYRNTLDHLENIVSPRSLRSVSERSVSAFAAGLRQLPQRGGKAGMEPYSIHSRLRFLHGALAWAARQKLAVLVRAGRQGVPLHGRAGRGEGATRAGGHAGQARRPPWRSRPASR